MKPTGSSFQDLQAEVLTLRERLQEAQETLEAIRSGLVDALVVSGPQGDQIFTLQGADSAYRVLVETMQEGAVTVTADGTILYANKRLADLLQMPLERVLGASIQQFIVAPDRPLFSALLKQGLQGRSRGELCLHGARTKVPVYLSLTPLPMTETDIPTICLVVTDLTEQKRNQEILAAERLSRSILEHAAEAIVVCDSHGYVLRASRTAAQLAQQDLLGQAFDELFSLSPAAFADQTATTADADQHEALLTPVLNGHTLTGVEVQLQTAHAAPRQLLLSAGPLWGAEQQILGCVVTLVDITIRKQAELTLRRSQEELERLVREQTLELRQQERLAAIGSAVARLAHEIGNPLNGISTTLQLFDYVIARSAEAVPDIIRDTVPDLKGEVDRLQNLLQNLRTVTRPQQLTRRPANPDVVASEVLRSQALAYTTQDVCIVEELQQQALSVSIDTEKLAQAILNLCKNAVEAMPRGGILTVRSCLDHDSYCLEVQDTGHGIPDGLNIFEPFATTKSHGTGLGLPIVKQIVEAHEGRIDYTSSRGHGTTFRIRLPVG